MSLLTIVQNACREIGFAVPTSVVANTGDQIAQQAWRMANHSGKTLFRRGMWQALHAEHTFTLVDGTQAYSLPSDYGYLLPDTAFNRSETQQLLLPVRPQEWQRLEADGATVSVSMRARIRDDTIEFYDSIGADQDGQTVAFEYVSSNWCESSAGAGQDSFLADADVSRLDEELHTLDVVWRLRNAKGLDFDLALNEFNVYLATVLGQDGGAKTLCQSKRRATADNFPETGYGS